jgi:hypothetical protein
MDQTAKQLTRGVVSLVEEVNRKLGARFEVVAIHGEPETHKADPRAWLTVSDLKDGELRYISYNGLPEVRLSAKERKAYCAMPFCERSYKTLGLSASEVSKLV